MEVTEVRAFNLANRTVLVKVTTDEGIVGWGECSPMQPPVIVAHIEYTLKHLVIGEDPFDLEKLIERMFVSPYKIAGQALAIAISGIEIALWDIIGKALGVPVYKLLGGAYRTKIPLYASSMRRDISPKDEAKRLSELVEKFGFKSVKVRIGNRFGADKDVYPGRSIEVVGEVKKALGDSIAIMVDANSAFTPSRAIEIGRKLQEFNIFHFEEPCPYTDLEANAKVAAALDVPIALGEQEWDLVRFREMMIKGACDIVQPDVIKVGGFLRCKKVAAMAEAFNIPVTLHNTQPAIGTIATLHFAASTPICRYPQEFNIEPHPFAHQIVSELPKVEGGFLTVPEAPGLGVEVNEEAIQQYCVNC
ncbi:MAG: mandelate racemase/muconate lactonizing enzyme family protein [Candidatus Fervidibacter sp.]|uniref:mandelate racemase/muconate lactonizing enzyme family protein n=1 Tax=Candidatus Fervidibacter sp. TaxID=3100871 RepID=UPI00404B2F40